MPQQIKYKMTEIEYLNMFNSLMQNKTDGFEFDQVRAFIRMTHTEQKRLWVDCYNYSKLGICPDYVKNKKAWYTGITNRLNQIKIVRSRAKEIRGELK